MKTQKINIEEILLKNIPEDCYWKDMGNLTNCPKEYILKAMNDFGNQLLELAAKNALSEFWGMHDYHGDHDCFGLDEEGCYKTNYTNEDGNEVELSFHFDKYSILNTINQIE